MEEHGCPELMIVGVFLVDLLQSSRINSGGLGFRF